MQPGEPAPWWSLKIMQPLGTEGHVYLVSILLRIFFLAKKKRKEKTTDKSLFGDLISTTASLFLQQTTPNSLQLTERK